MENITNIYDKLSSIFKANNGTTDDTTGDTSDPNTIDILKTFSSANIDITPIIIKILKLHPQFPQHILHSKDGHKYNELEFFKSNLDSNVDSNTQSLFDKFNRTQTQLGKTLLQSIILEPTININGIIKHRQALATKFMKHKQLNEICSRLEKCKVLERDILAMQMSDTPEMLEVYKVIFFEFLPLKKLNYSEIFLKLFYYFIIIFSPIYGLVAPFVFMFAPFVFMRYVLKIPISFNMFWMTLKTMILGGTGFFSKLDGILNSNVGKAAESMIVGGEGSSIFSVKNVVITLVKWIVAFMNSTLGTYVYFGFIIITYLYGVYNTTQVSITYNKVINMFHSRLNIIAKWLQSAVTFYKMGLGFESPEIASVVGQIKELLETNTTIANLLQHPTFTNEPSIFSNKGIIIKTFKEFLDMKETILEPFCKYMAHIDVWSSVGKWLSEGYGVNRNLCSFVQGSDKPLVDGCDVWNICCDVPVYNDVMLGINKENENKKDILLEKYNNLLITGPNGSGKSTYIKSVIECILLGQTIGVVPAKEFSFTPFTNIATYLNIPDCQGKESLFQAEMNRCYQQIQMLKGAEEKGEFSFNIMDEIFVSTNYQEGMSGAYAIIKRMCNMNKCLNIITTHFDVLAGMEEVKVSKKYFDIEIDEGDNIMRDYKIKDGVSKKHMALKLLKKKGFDASIIEDAEYLYEKLQGGSVTKVVADDSMVDNSVCDDKIVNSSLDTKDILEDKDNNNINSSLDTKDILKDNLEDINNETK